MAYFDDSGTHDDAGLATGAEVVVAAGYVGAIAEWWLFDADWNTFLHRHSLLFYHSADCSHGTNQFAGVSTEVRNRLHREAVELITKRNLVAIGSAAATKAYIEQYLRDLSPENHAVQRPGYYECLWNSLSALAYYMNTMKPKERAAVYVEQSAKTAEATLFMYREAAQRANGPAIQAALSGPPQFRQKMGNPPLQAADVLAYEMGLKLRRQFGFMSSDRQRRSWDALARHAIEQAAGIEMHLIRFRES